MRVKILLVMTFVLACTTGDLAQGQQQDPQQPQQTVSTGGQPSPLDIQGIKGYLLGPGDVVEIRVFGQPDLASTAQVDSDGNLSSLPFLDQAIPAKCRTE